MSTCGCAETLVWGNQVEKPRFHSCAYVRLRMSFIPQAMEYANQVTDPALLDVMDKTPCEGGGFKPGRQIAYGNTWTRNFSAEMERLLAAHLQNGQKNTGFFIRQ